MPVRFDTYSGCGHGCSYCFVRRKRGLKIDLGESYIALTNFINGKRNNETKWCDWDIPLHWGGVSDPFQPVELEYERSLKSLEVIADTGYPVTISTKSILPASEPYRSLIKSSNVVFQMSMVSPQYNKMEAGAPSFNERLDKLQILSEVSKRLIIRVQPYSLGLVDEVVGYLPMYKECGVYGITIEGLKRMTKGKGFVKVGGDWCYPSDKLAQDYEIIRDVCRSLGLAFYCAENRLRFMGDDPCCCGAVGVDGFVQNTANMNHLGENGEIEYRDKMLELKTGGSFAALAQMTRGARTVRAASYKEMMELIKKTKRANEVMGLAFD